MNSHETVSEETLSQSPQESVEPIVDSGGETDHEAASSSSKTDEAVPAIDFLSRLKMAELEKKVSEYETKIGSIRDYVKNLETEMEAARERAKRDQDKQVDQKLTHVFRELVSVADNLARSVKAAEGDTSSLAEGIRMVFNQWLESLNRLGLERMSTKGEPFNPEIHEALTTMPVSDASLDQKVMDEVQSGFRYKGILVRPAQVIVGRLSES